MTTIINTPGNNSGSGDDGMGAIVGIILLIVVLVLFFVFALPAIRNSQQAPQPGANINVTLPGGTTNTPAANH